MKYLIMAAFLISGQGFAASTIVCTNASKPAYTYALKEIDYDHYEFAVSKKNLASESCRSRWGCDEVEEMIFTDKVRFTDVQGAYVFKSKRSYLVLEDWDDVAYVYRYKNANGTYVNETETLKCREI